MNEQGSKERSASMTRVLIADDSSFMRKSLRYILQADPSIEVIGAVPDGVEALRQTCSLRPDVVLMDIEMPQMDGLAALKRIMAECPTPVVILTGLAERDPALALKALDFGAVEFIAKPSGAISYDIEQMAGEILAKVKMAASVDVHKLKLRFAPQPDWQAPLSAAAAGKTLVVIGASTGGPRAIMSVLSGLPHDLPAAILIIQHMGAKFLPSLADRLDAGSPLAVALARDGATIRPGQVLVAPWGFKTSIAAADAKKNIRLMPETPPGLLSPSIDHAMQSAALAYGRDVLGVLLTGMGSDGALGMQAIKAAGGATLAEDESSCVVFGMPRAAIELGCVDRVVPLEQIAATIRLLI